MAGNHLVRQHHAGVIDFTALLCLVSVLDRIRAGKGPWQSQMQVDYAVWDMKVECRHFTFRYLSGLHLIFQRMAAQIFVQTYHFASAYCQNRHGPSEGAKKP